MFRSRSWFGGGWIRPKKRLSLDHLKYLCGILEKNTYVSENNRGLLVESLRCIAEILIWGDQHDSSVFDFFLEKNMLSYFLHIMRQKSGGSSYVCVQLLQTLNILFENIRNQTSLYYLLSNNHVNSIMVHKFDFSDEDVMGYYILFLKTLSLKLNTHTIHFFYNEHTNDFPLYTEAIKFFNHPESMVRIAVRTISLNVYKVQNDSMLNFIRDKTAAPYFSNLVWFIGKHILELDACVRTDFDHQSNQKLSNLVAEHLDHLHYLNDILLLEIHDLNAVLTEHLLHKLFIPLYILSLTPAPPLSMAMVTHNLAAVLNKVVEIEIEEVNHPRVSSVVALYLLSLVFLVITHGPLVHALAWVILNADQNVFVEGATEILNAYDARREIVVPGFAKPTKSLEEALGTVVSSTSPPTHSVEINVNTMDSNSTTYESDETKRILETMHRSNVTDEEKEKLKRIVEVSTSDVLRPFLDVVLSSLDCVESDYLPLLSLCLIYAMVNNKSVRKDWLDQVLTNAGKSPRTYKAEIIESLLNIINLFYQPSYRIRLITLEISLELLYTLKTSNSDGRCISECQPRTLFLALNQAMSELRQFFKSEEMFLDIFENDFDEIKKSTLNVEFLCMDSTILLPPTGTPLTGIPFTRRLPCGEVEKARRAIQGFFLIRRTCQKFLNETEAVLPLTNAIHCVQVDNVLDLNNSDLIACTVLTKDNTKQRRFLVIDSLQLILVEPDAKLLGWGIAKLVGFLQDVEVVGDKDDSRCLHITVHRGGMSHNRAPLLSAKFLFDDHIRCMAAKQRLTKGRSKARQRKMYQIAQLIEVSSQMADSTAYAISSNRAGCTSRNTREPPIFSDSSPFPGFAAALGKEKMLFSGRTYTNTGQNQPLDRIHDGKNRRSRRRSSNSSSGLLSESEELVNNSLRRKSSSSSPDNYKNWSLRSREASVRKLRPTSEDIPLEDLNPSSNSCPHSRSSSNDPSSSPTPRSKNELSFKTASPNEPSLLSQTKSAVVVNPDAFVSSEETSFISQEVREQQKGNVEIV